MTDEPRNYRPLFILIAVAALAGYTIAPPPFFPVFGWMHAFMGIFLCIFAMLKLFSPSKFADGFSMYDLLAKQFRPYAYVYPYLELALGLAYLSHTAPQLTYIVTIVLFGFSAIGVLLALKKGLNVNCACMGNILNVPLSTVTLTEDIAMIAMAAWMLLA